MSASCPASCKAIDVEIFHRCSSTTHLQTQQFFRRYQLHTNTSDNPNPQDWNTCFFLDRDGGSATKVDGSTKALEFTPRARLQASTQATSADQNFPRTEPFTGSPESPSLLAQFWSACSHASRHQATGQLASRKSSGAVCWPRAPWSCVNCSPCWLRRQLLVC